MKKAILFLALALLAVEVMAGDPVIDTVSYSPSPAIPGQVFNIYIHLKNNSNTYNSENVEFEIDLSGGSERDANYPFSLAGAKNMRKISTLKPNKTALIEYRIEVNPTALDGAYILKFKFREGGASKEYNYTINIESRNPDIEIVNSDSVTIAPGQASNIALTIRNLGNSEARDILVGIEEERTVTTTGVVVEREFASLGASFDFIKSLAAGRETIATISLAVNPNTEQKTYTIPITLKYKDSNSNIYTDTAYIGVQVAEEPELDTVISEIEPVAFPDGTSEITIDLFNVGVGTAKYVVVELSTNAGILEQEKVFIGTLEADDFDSFKTDLTFSPGLDITKDHALNITLKYKNQYGEAKEDRKQVLLKLNSAASAQGINPVGIVLGLIGTALTLLGLFTAGKWGYKRFVKKA